MNAIHPGYHVVEDQLLNQFLLCASPCSRRGSKVLRPSLTSKHKTAAGRLMFAGRLSKTIPLPPNVVLLGVPPFPRFLSPLPPRLSSPSTLVVWLRRTKRNQNRSAR